MPYKVVPDGSPANPTWYAFYNQYTGQCFYENVVTPYILQEGDIVITDPDYYENGPFRPDMTITPPRPGPFSIVENGTTNEVLDFSPVPAGGNTNPNDPEQDCSNYPAGNDQNDPGYVDVEPDPNYSDEYEQYYDDGDEPVYSSSECDSSVGIRG